MTEVEQLAMHMADRVFGPAGPSWDALREETRRAYRANAERALDVMRGAGFTVTRDTPLAPAPADDRV